MILLLNRNPKSYIVWLCIIASGALFFIPFLGSVSLFDWDEINFAEAAREMIVTGDYLNVQINYLPFWEKPPFFFWLQVVSMKLFGINEFGARFPNVLCGILSLMILYQIGRKLFDHRMGMIWTLVYAGSLLPFFYFKSGIIDPWFNLFIFLGIFFGMNYLLVDSKRSLFALLSGSFVGMAILTKGPVALLLFGLTGLVYLIVIRFKLRLRLLHVVLFTGGLLVTGGFWFIIQYLTGHADVIDDFILYQIRLFQTQDAGHGGFPLYHVFILLLGVFPATAFALSGIQRSTVETVPVQKAWHLVNIILLIVVLVVFSAVKTKIVHYSSLAYFPLTWLAARYIYRVLDENTGFNRLTRIFIYIFGTIWVLVSVLLVVNFLNKDLLLASGIIKDAFAIGNLQADVIWSGWEMLIGLTLLLAIILFFLLKNTWLRVVTLFGGTMVFAFLTMAIIVPKVEGYSQRAAIEFYKQKSAEDCYLHTMGFKSYAHLFYGRKMPPVNPDSYSQDWLLHGPIDKPVYFVFRITRKDRYIHEYPHLQLLYEKNGFVFARRDKHYTRDDGT